VAGLAEFREQSMNRLPAGFAEDVAEKQKSEDSGIRRR
jgi:hypothetical protein